MTESLASPVRTAAISFLNAAPLMAGLAEDPDFQLFYTRPSDCARALAAGEADLGLIPAIELARIAGLRAVAGVGVAARRQVRSILLVSRVPAREVHTLLLDPASRTSAALAQILLRQWFKADLRRVETAVGEPRPLLPPPGTARLLIGDPALLLCVRGAPAPARLYDLATAWHSWTGLPFVFALWGVHAGAVAGREAWLTARLAAARREGRNRQPALVAEWSRRLDLEPAEVERYLTQDVEYDLTGEHMDGLQRFFQLAADAGLIAGPALPQWLVATGPAARPAP